MKQKQESHPCTLESNRNTASCKIHVVYIITKLELGGAQKICLTLFDGLTPTGIATYLISGDQGFLVEQVRTKKNVFLIPNLKRELSLKSLSHEVRAFWQLIQKLRELKKKHPLIIIHTHSTKAGILGRWAAFFSGIPRRVHTIHGYAFHEHQSTLTWLLLYLPELFTSFITTHFICVSTADIKTGIKLFPRFAHKHSMIRAAVDWQQFFTPAVQTSFPTTPMPHFIFGTVACFKPQKNLFDLLQAFAWVHKKNPHTYLEIIGDGIQRPALEAWIKQHNLSTVIILHGWQDKVAPLMRCWNTFVLSSLWEGLPCAVIEARLLKLPVISYATGGIPDVIKHEQNGLLCKKGDWSQLAQHMLTMSQDQVLYKKLHNQSDMLDDFQDAYMVHAHDTLYKKLCTSKKMY